MFTNQKSLADTGRVYTEVQFRVRPDGRVNVQVAGPSSNRGYGAAAKGSVDEATLADLTAVSGAAEQVKSLAGTTAPYAKALARRTQSGGLKWQIPFTVAVTAKLEGVNAENLRGSEATATAEGYVSLRTDAGTFQAVEDALASANESTESFDDEGDDDDFGF